MPMLQIYVDEETMRRLKHGANETGRTVEDLAETSVSETALYATRGIDFSAKPKKVRG